MSSYPLYPLSANHVHKLSADTQSFAPEITFEKTPRFLGKVYDKVNAARKSKVDDNTAKMQSIKQLGV